MRWIYKKFRIITKKHCIKTQIHWFIQQLKHLYNNSNKRKAKTPKIPRSRTQSQREEGKRTITATSMASSSSSGLTFKLHPLVIVNISDHYTRVKSQTNGCSDGGPPSPPPRVYGCVIGVQRGRTVEIFNSFELLYDPVTHSLDRAFIEKKQELCIISISYTSSFLSFLFKTLKSFSFSLINFL